MDGARKWTDGELAEMERHLQAIYSAAEEDVKAKLLAHIAKFRTEDEARRKEVEKATKNGGGNAKELAKSWVEWRRKKIFSGNIWRHRLAEISERYLAANQIATDYINGEVPKIAARNFNEFESIANQAAEKYHVPSYSFAICDEQTIKKLATENRTLLPYKEIDGKKDVRWNTQKINAQILQGILQGDNINGIAKRLERTTEMNRVSAVRNARTAVTGAECAGRQNSYIEAEKSGMELLREWICTHDSRSREWHLSLGGATTAVGEPFRNDFGEIMFPGDPNARPENVYNCRCSIMARVVGFHKPNYSKKSKG